MEDLIWFNGRGDSLNVNYNQSSQRFEADLFFDENGTDTFKTIPLYMFEKIPEFEYTSPGDIELEKFQLFNEYGFNFYGSTFSNIQITSIYTPNTDPTFYSKWITGTNFETLFPIGSQVYFNNTIFEFSDSNQSYTVVQTMKNSIMIISNTNNQLFNTLYGIAIGMTASYNNAKISGLNSIGIYNYINPDLTDNISYWSQQDFYTQYYKGKKLNIVNTSKNNSVVTVENTNLIDNIYWEYILPLSSFTSSNSLIIELILKTEPPIIYNGGLIIDTSRVYFNGVPPVLKPGIQFTIPGSILNVNFITVASIPTFLGNTQLTYYATQSQVLWNNNIYQCISAYTQSILIDISTGNPSTFSTTPDNGDYWTSSITYVPTVEVLSNETILNTEVHLTTNKLYFTGGYTGSNLITLASVAQSNSSTFNSYGINLYYSDVDESLHSDLNYASQYAIVNYYNGQVGSSYSIGGYRRVLENMVGTTEILAPEKNNKLSSNFNYNIVFDSIDDFGILIRINNETYQEGIDWVNQGLNNNIPRSLDRTLRNWISKNYIRLSTLGIIPSLSYIGSYTSIYYNSIVLKTQYPNVPLEFTVEVGSTSDFHIEHSDVIFYDMGGYLNITINDHSYGQASVYTIQTATQSVVNIPQTLSNWITSYSSILSGYGIYVSSINNALFFNLKNIWKTIGNNEVLYQRLVYTISTGKSSLPGIDQFIIKNKLLGYEGSIIASNEIILSATSSQSFENENFATGMITSVNNTIFPYDNQSYNLLYVGPKDLVLSYQGPFWGNANPFCDISAYASIAFNSGFGSTGCYPIIGPTSTPGGGAFGILEFSQSFNIQFGSTNIYTPNTYNLNSYVGTTNMVDIIYIGISENIYVLGNDLTIIDSTLAQVSTSISLSGNTQSVCVKYNVVNNYLYVITNHKIFVIDPLIDVVVYKINLTFTPHDCVINDLNGDVFISYINSQKVDIWSYANFTNTPTKSISTSGNTYNLLYNSMENRIYVTTDASSVIEITPLNNTILATYSIVGLTNSNESIFYEPTYGSVYVFGSYLYNISNGVSTQITSVTASTFNYLLYDNTVGVMVISQNQGFGSYKKLDLSNNLISTLQVTSFGQMICNQYDGDVYMASGSKILVMDTLNNVVKHTEVFGIGNITKLVYNTDRRSIWGIQPTTNSVIEVQVDIVSEIVPTSPTYSNVFDSQYGTLDPHYVQYSDIWLKTREFIRRPRENYNNDIQVEYVWKWQDDQTPEMFLYDFSGNQLPTGGLLSYIGQKPLDVISLNSIANADISKIGYPEYQQTVFTEIVEKLDYINSSTNLSYMPTPMETFVGFNSKDEGVTTSILSLYKRELVSFVLTPTYINNNTLIFTYVVDINNGDYGIISLNVNSVDNFVSDSLGNLRGLKSGQLLQLTINDTTNLNNKFISMNNGKIFQIRNVYSRSIVVDFLTNSNTSLVYGATAGYVMVNETNVISNFPVSGSTTYLNTNFCVVDSEIARFTLYGQTEIEDIRYKTELSNVGQNINADDVFIFKPYDINEQGVDWGYLNKKRKEMLMVRHDIFPYIGSYKAIINSINYFGYNDLELYEYYKNINVKSDLFGKLFKVEIPDIFDNTTAGWTVNDFLKKTQPNNSYETTNLFNLTYNITDKQGNNVLLYSLQEVIIKLEGLKHWLENKVIPVTHKILDITGRADFVGGTSIIHKPYGIKTFNFTSNMTPIDFKLDESYLQPINSGSTVYTCLLNFYTADSSYPDSFTIKVKTYKTYLEWNAFVNYNIGDDVQYYDRIFESKIADNQLNNPLLYDGVPVWNSSSNYINGQIVNYNSYIYEYTNPTQSFLAIGTQSVPSPYVDTNDWLDITKWREIDYVPVQTLKEFRTGTHSYTFTVDSNIDPYITIEVTSDNGYGQIYQSRKNYQIQGELGLTSPTPSLSGFLT